MSRRDYVTITPRSEDWYDVDGKDSLARTVYESEELVDIGVLDPAGNKVMARKRIDPIGFVRWQS